MARRNREKDHIAIGHDGALHRFLGVVAFRDFDLGGGQATAGQEGLQGGQVRHGVGDRECFADLRGALEFTTVSLTVIDRQRVQFVACGVQVVEQDGGVEPSGVYDDGFHEFSGLPTRRALGIQ